MLTVERAEVLTDFLKSDIARTEELFAMEPEVALEAINSNGFDFELSEINEYCDEFKTAVAQGELEESQLDGVSGGVVITTGIVLGLIGCFAGGAAIGIAAGARW